MYALHESVAVLRTWDAMFRTHATATPPPPGPASESSSGIVTEPSSEDENRTGRGRELGLAVFEWMAAGGGVVPNTFAFNLLLEACANTDHTQDALRVFGWMLLGKGFTEGVHLPDTITFNIMIKLCQRTGLLSAGGRAVDRSSPEAVQEAQMRHLGLQAASSCTQQTPTELISSASTNERSLNHLGQHTILPPKLKAGSGFDNLGPGSWQATLDISKESLMLAMDLATRYTPAAAFPKVVESDASRCR